MRNSLRTGLLLLAVTAAPAVAQDGRLQVHGYLTQAYGSATSGQYLGIPEGGTADYRNAALQFRYSASPSDNFVWQVSHRRLGTSPITAGEEELKVDWVFFSHQIGAATVKLGRIPIPAGIYNEIRDVGVLLPLYRAPFDFYLEGAFTSETVDGAVASYQLFPDASWSFDLSAYGGRFDMVNRATVRDTLGAPVGYAPQVADVKTAFGAQAWVNTPIDGVRFGGGASHDQVANGDFEGDWSEWHGSFDARLPQVTVQSEYRRFSIPDVDYTAYYVYAGFHATPRLTLHGQAEFADIVLTTTPGTPKFQYDRTKALGVSYAVRSDLVVKGEYHFTKGYWADAPALDPGAPIAKVNYLLVSVSTSF